MITSIIRRRVLPAVLAAALAGGLASGPALAATSPKATAGLFGSGDPTYDGVFRQSLALLGLTAAQTPLPVAAVSWLTGQQCTTGAFEAFRPDPARACAQPDPVNFTGPDSNSTALAAMALRAAGRSAASARAVAALLGAQNGDGGWGYTLGSASDVNSTGLALAAVHGSAPTPSARAAATRATRYLSTAQGPCPSAATGGFGLPYQPGKPADPLASAQGLVGLAGSLPVVPRLTAASPVTCASPAPARIASFLGSVVRRTDGAIPSALDSTQTDWNTTATAALALAGAGGQPGALRIAMSALRDNVVAYTGSGSGAKPAALGTLIQAAVATGSSPVAFGRTNLVSALLATLQK